MNSIVKALLVLIIFGSGSMAAIAQDEPASAEWNKTFGGKYYEEAYSVIQTSDGGYALTGTTYSPGNADVFLIKTDENGNERWNRTFSGSSYDVGVFVEQASDGGYIIAAHTESYGAGSSDGWLIKTDSNGNEEWNKTFGGPGFDLIDDIQMTSDSGYILTGFTYSYGTMGDFWLIKTDSNGKEQWNRTFGGTNYDYSFAVRQTSDGGYIMTGFTYSYGAMGDILLVKTDSNGKEQWSKTFGGKYYEEAHSVQQTKDGGYVLAGGTYSYGDGNSDAWLIKTDSNGKEQWNKTFGGTDYDFIYSVLQTPDGGYITAGTTYTYGPLGDLWVIKTDSNGNEEWDRTLGGAGYEEAHDIRQTSEGDYILAAFTYSYGAGNSDAWLVKVRQPPKLSPNGSISGYVINDMNGNGVWDEGETGISDVSLWLTGMAILKEVSTDAQGFYKFDNLPAGLYFVVEMTPMEWMPTSSTVKYVVTLGTGENSSNNNFTNMLISTPSTTSSISGYIINDTNNDGIWNEGETGIPGWNIRVKEISGLSIQKETATDASGFYRFDDLSSGRYIVTERIQKGWRPTNQTTRRITMATEDNFKYINFTNNQISDNLQS